MRIPTGLCRLRRNRKCPSVPVAMAAAAATAATGAGGGGIAAGGGAGGEGGKFLIEFGGAAMGAGGASPVSGADEDFAVPLALFAMKFVDRHG